MPRKIHSFLFSWFIISGVLNIFGIAGDIVSNPEILYAIAPAVAGGLIAGGGAILGALISRPKRPPKTMEEKWMEQYGPGMWNFLRTEGYDLYQNPYGIPENIKQQMRTTQRDTLSAGYGAARQGIRQNTALSGLSAAGGDATRQEYYAGETFGQNLAQAYGAIDIADWQAREEQKARGLNMIMSLSNKNPVYSQLASQNYWNAVNQANMGMQAIGGAAGSIASMYMMDQWMKQNPYQTGMGNSYINPYLNYNYGGSGGYQGYQSYYDWYNATRGGQNLPGAGVV